MRSVLLVGLVSVSMGAALGGWACSADDSGGTSSGGADGSIDPGGDGGPQGCVPRTCAEAGKDCGPISDGCGGFTESCGECEEPEVCGADEPSVCGVPEGGGGSGDDCDGGLCEHQVACPDDGATTLTGQVFAPDGVTPLNNAVVYVPNDPDPTNLPPIPEGASCERCEDEDLGDPIAAAVSGPDGSFILRHVPADVEFPLVVKIGKWRRVVTLPAVSECTSRDVSTAESRLPRNAAEGHIPKIAVSTGRVDALECVLRKMGVDDGEFTRPVDDGRVHLYRSNGAWADESLRNNCRSDCTNNNADTWRCNSASEPCRDQLSRNLYRDQTVLDGYDMTFFGCDWPIQDDERSNQWQSPDDYDRMRSYGNEGGRVFLSHYNYEWLSHDPGNMSSVADFTGGHSVGIDDPSEAFVDTGFGRGLTMAQWLQHVGATTEEGVLEIHEPRTHIRFVNDPARRWIYTTQEDHNRDSVQSFTFNMPLDVSEDETCGRMVYSAFHVVGGGNDQHRAAFPNHCDDGPLTPQEQALVFMMFDLAACISDDDTRQPPGGCTPVSCEDVGAECDTIVDGCGGLTDCGQCPETFSCVSNECVQLG